MGMKEAVESFDKEKKMSEILNFKGEDALWPLWRKGQDKFCALGRRLNYRLKPLLFLQREQGSVAAQRLICLGGISWRRRGEEGGITSFNWKTFFISCFEWKGSWSCQLSAAPFDIWGLLVGIRTVNSAVHWGSTPSLYQKILFRAVPASSSLLRLSRSCSVVGV